MLPSALLRSTTEDEMVAHISAELGIFVRVTDAWRLLGYPSPEAARKAALRNRFPIDVIKLPERRGRFVRSKDLAAWLFEAMDCNRTLSESAQRPIGGRATDPSP